MRRRVLPYGLWTTFAISVAGCGGTSAEPSAPGEGATGDTQDEGEDDTGDHDAGGSTSAASAGDSSGGTDTSVETGGSSTGSAQPIGMLVERGSRSFDQSTTDPPACDDVCADLGGFCDDLQAGRSYYDCGSSEHGSPFYSCAWPEDPEYYDAEGDLCRLTEYSCQCHDVLLEAPRVEVSVDDGLHACDEVCQSWNLECEGGGDVYDEAQEWLTSVDCATAPDDPATYEYVCLCDR